MAEAEAAAQSMEVEARRTAGDEDDDDHFIPDSENPTATLPDSKSDLDSSSDSDSDDDAQLNLEVQTLEAALSNNPSDYDAHVNYIRALRKLGDIEKLRQARDAMSALFPLSPDMWREWVRDETTLNSRPESVPAIEALYERGISDYLSVALWIDYVNFVQEHDPLIQQCSANGITKARNLFERAVTAGGLHVTEGSRIYESYREFEQSMLLNLGEADSESKEKQVQRIRKLFFRQLSVPLSEMSSTLLTYKAWETEQGSVVDNDPSSLDGLPSHIASAYQKALEMLKLRTNFEEQIARKDASDSERLQEFMNYLNFEQSSGDPARVQILYERAITQFPISADLWLDYTCYLDKTIKTSSVVKDVYARATRNCPWVGELWTKYLLYLERVNASEDEISAVFEKSVQCTFTSYDEYLDLYLTRVDGLRRRISSTGSMDDTFNYSLIRDVFQRASDYLSPYLKNTDSLLRMYSYWSRLELNLGMSVVAARGVWESLLRISGSMSEAWKGYIDMEIGAGNINEARLLYKRCYTKRFSNTGSEDICHSWVRFEREYGSLEDYDVAVQKVKPRIAELQVFRAQQESKSTSTTEQKESSTKKSTREKRKLDSDKIDQSRAKRQKDTVQYTSVKIEKDKTQAAGFEEKDKVGGGEIDASKSGSTRIKESDNPSPNKLKHFNDQCTAFISNLNFKTTNEDLHTFFSDVGGVAAIRILKDKFTGKSRGLAYVDFADESHLAAAVAKNRQYLLGKRLSIARSDPKGKKKGAAGIGNSSKKGADDDQNSRAQTSDSKEGSGSLRKGTSQKSGDDNVQLKGRNTFAMPRSVRPLGWTKTSGGPEEEAGDEKPKSNEEFRKMFMKT